MAILVLHVRRGVESAAWLFALGAVLPVYSPGLNGSPPSTYSESQKAQPCSSCLVLVRFSLRFHQPVHSDAGDPDCCGGIVPDIRGDLADLVCNECGTLLEQDVPINEVNGRLAKLAPIRETAHCPYCGALNVFPRFLGMHAFICQECGQGVLVDGVEQ